MNAGGRWEINPPLPEARRPTRSKKSPLPPTHRIPIQSAERATLATMADWRMKMERAMVELASGDEAKAGEG